mmetsp:Transcript_35384/g.101649  ORF Transcript_35384/g.101649 Transcript_35384/m.101649 type:complete len:540 (+) Transcript_35384:168-1787(+)
MAARTEVEALGRRALRPWIEYVARRPLPRGDPSRIAPRENEAGTHGVVVHEQGREALAEFGTSRAEVSEAISKHFVLSRHGRTVGDDGARRLWSAVSCSSLKNLGGRELCDLLHVLSRARGYADHAQVAATVAESLCVEQKHWEGEISLWPQTLPLVTEYLSRHISDLRKLAVFLEHALVPFWRRYPGTVAATLLPHHLSAVSGACVRCSKFLRPESVETVRTAILGWVPANLTKLGPRGTAGVTLAVSRMGLGLGGEEARNRLLGALLQRAAELSDEDPEAPPIFRPDWLGMFLSALARARCRERPDIITRLLAAHLLPLGSGGIEGTGWSREVQNLALVAHAAVKLDLHSAGLDPRAPACSTTLCILSPTVSAACAAGHFSGRAGARSAGLLAHAFGLGLLLLRARGAEGITQACSSGLQAVLEASMALPTQSMQVRFQLLSAVQCWWCAVGGPRALLPELRIAHRIGGGPLPSAEESVEGQEWISTKSHAEVLQSLPPWATAQLKTEEFAFPFWLDLVIAPSLARRGNARQATDNL